MELSYFNIMLLATFQKILMLLTFKAATWRSVSPLTFFLSNRNACLGILNISSFELWFFILGGSLDKSELSCFVFGESWDEIFFEVLETGLFLGQKSFKFSEELFFGKEARFSLFVFKASWKNQEFWKDVYDWKIQKSVPFGSGLFFSDSTAGPDL